MACSMRCRARRSAPAGGERGDQRCIVDAAADEDLPVSSPPAVEPGPFAEALRRSVRTWAVAAGLAAAVTLELARTYGALPCAHAAAFLLTGLVGIPLLFPLALGAAMGVLWSLLALVAVPWWIVQRRATGLAALGRELAALLGSLLPGYWRALRRVDRPVLWGLVLGFVVGTGLAVAVFSLRPPAA